MQIIIFILSWLALFFLFRTVALRKWPEKRGERIDIPSFGLAMLCALIAFRVLLAVEDRPAGPDFQAELERLRAEAKVMPEAVPFDTVELRGMGLLHVRGSEHGPRAAFARASAVPPRPAIALRAGSDRDARYLIILRDTIRLVMQRQVEGSRGEREWVQYPLEEVTLESCVAREKDCTAVSPEAPANPDREYRLAGRPHGTELYPVVF